MCQELLPYPPDVPCLPAMAYYSSLHDILPATMRTSHRQPGDEEWSQEAIEDFRSGGHRGLQVRGVRRRRGHKGLQVRAVRRPQRTSGNGDQGATEDFRSGQSSQGAKEDLQVSGL